VKPGYVIFPALLAAAIGVATCMACGGGSAPVAPGDAGSVADVAAPSRDAQPDGGEVDAAVGAWDWLPGEWELPAGVPSFCELRSAKNPARDIPPLQWKACPSGRSGCRTLVVDWHTGPGARQSVSNNPEPVQRLRSGETIVSYTRWYPDPRMPGTFDRTMDIVYTLDGSARVGYAGDARLINGREAGSQRCIGLLSGGDDGYVELHSLSQERTNIATSASWTSPATTKVSRAFTDAELNQGAGMHSNDGTTVYVTTQITGGLALLDLASNTATIPRDGAQIAAIEGARPVKDGAVVFRLGATQIMLDHLRKDGSTTRLVTPPGTRQISGFAVDRSQNESLVWVEADEIQPATNTVLFTSPAATNAAAVVRRRVTAFDDPGGDGGGRMIANAGFALLLTGKTTALLVRLADGSGWTIHAEPDTVFVKAMWVDEQDVWIATGIRPYFPSEITYEDGIVRLARTSLGAPDVAPK
jgi:hypothetical protein